MKMSEKARKLAEDNHNLIYSFIRKHKLNIDEWYGVLAESLCISATKFDESKGAAFSTYAYFLFEKKFAQCCRAKYNTKKTIPDNKLLSGDYEYDNGKDKSTLFDAIEDKRCIETETLNRSETTRYVMSLKEIDKIIFFMMRDGYKQEVIAEKVGITQSYVSRKQKKMRKELEELLCL